MDSKIRKKKCHLIRNDGKFIEAGENDNLIVQKLKNDKNALGIFGFSFLEENRGSIQPTSINQNLPSFDNIVSGAYPISRPLFIYFKKEHLNLIDGMHQFIAEIISTNTIVIYSIKRWFSVRSLAFTKIDFSHDYLFFC